MLVIITKQIFASSLYQMIPYVIKKKKTSCKEPLTIFGIINYLNYLIILATKIESL